MRKSLLIAVLALATAAWAQTSGINPAERQDLNQDNQQQVNQQTNLGSDWYSQHLAPRSEEFVHINQFVSPKKTEFLQAESINPLSIQSADFAASALPGSMAKPSLGPNEQPGSMAAGEGAQGGTGYWYNTLVQVEANFNARQIASMRHQATLSEGQSARNE